MLSSTGTHELVVKVPDGMYKFVVRAVCFFL